MTETRKRLLFALFLLSGFCGLLYQVVWMRMSFASFGVITPVLSVVISVFMFGLFAGSWLAGRAVEPLTAKTGISAIWFYALAELLIGVGAFAVPRLFSWGEAALLPVGAADSAAYLFWSAVIIACAILPWTLFMGTTFPLMMSYVREQDDAETTSFSFLYLGNVIGAMAGTFITAVVLIELLGFHGTLRVAAGLNLLIAVSAAFLGLSRPSAPAARRKSAPARAAEAAPLSSLGVLILFTTGFTSMAMEVVWTRAFTVVLQTQVYSFALLLFVYLLGTWIGSLKYRKHLARGGVVSTAQLLAWLAAAALLPVALNDPRLRLQGVGAMISIFPFCALLGYLTPKLIDEHSAGNPESAGALYAINILGCILGPLAASYLMLPQLGVKYSLLLLAAPYLGFFLFGAAGRPFLTLRREAFAVLGLALASVLIARTYEEQGRGYLPGESVVRRDNTATVISFGKGLDGKRLLVNGIGITHLTTITKVMAHLPLVLLDHKPTSALVICFGMGTTFRSLMSWGIDVTAVELVPGVKDAFPYYFDDAAEIMKRPNGKVVIDDGRRFLRRTTETFDVVTLDPPPPVEAAGSSLLYSEEFYATVKSRLKPGGILQQWVPATEGAIVEAIAGSLIKSFPYVKIYRSHEGWGNHFLASMTPIDQPALDVLMKRMPAAAKADLVEWNGEDPERFLGRVLSTKMSPDAILNGSSLRITDDRPYNEYFILRRVARRILHGKSSS
ncbi:MAG: hypothetical protein ACHQ51_12315 [Elusimicrobiota bacterium]